MLGFHLPYFRGISNIPECHGCCRMQSIIVAGCQDAWVSSQYVDDIRELGYQMSSYIMVSKCQGIKVGVRVSGRKTNFILRI